MLKTWTTHTTVKFLALLSFAPILSGCAPENCEEDFGIALNTITRELMPIVGDAVLVPDSMEICMYEHESRFNMFSDTKMSMTELNEVLLSTDGWTEGRDWKFNLDTEDVEFMLVFTQISDGVDIYVSGGNKQPQ